MPTRPIAAFSAFVALFIACACTTPRGVTMHERPRGDGDFGPWSATDAHPSIPPSSRDRARPTSTARDGLVDFVFDAYSGYLTKIDGARCEHRPTCSKYAYLSIKRHGYVVGSLLTIDRLLRGRRSSVLRELEIYKVEDGARYHYDPVENNDFYF